MNVSVSAVIPTYRRHEEVLAAVESVLNQTRPVDEIIVCNDGPDPEKRLLLEKLGRDEIKFVEAPRRGLPAATRNYAIKQASGDLIALLDDDDVWGREKIEAQLKMLPDTSRPIVISGREKIFVDGGGSYIHPVETYKAGKAITYMLRTGGFHTSTIVASRSLFMDHPLREDIPRHEDWEWILSVSDAADFHMVPDIVCTRSYTTQDGRVTQGGKFHLTFEWLQANSSRLPRRAKTYLLCKTLSRKAAHDRDFRAGISVLVNVIKNRDITLTAALWLVLPWISSPRIRNWMKLGRSSLARG